jgi:hypothetical protein
MKAIKIVRENLCVVEGLRNQSAEINESDEDRENLHVQIENFNTIPNLRLISTNSSILLAFQSPCCEYVKYKNKE